MTISDLAPSAAEGDVWIDAPMAVNTGEHAQFFGMAACSFPYGMSGPAVASVKFNLTAYVKNLIEQSNRRP